MLLNEQMLFQSDKNKQALNQQYMVIQPLYF
jgi:hypothetical protein